MQMVYTPDTLGEALALLAEKGALPVAGCTNYLVDRYKGKAPPGTLVSLDGVDGLRDIHTTGEGGFWVGGRVSFTQLEKDTRLPAALRQAARAMGGPQIRNRASIAGNIVSASPAADGVPPLAVLGARLRIASSAGTREVPLEGFLLGPGKTALAPGEIIEAVLLSPSWGKTAYYKVGRRNALAIAVVNMAVQLEMQGGLIHRVAIAVGSVGPTVIRALETEQLLTGERPSAPLFERAGKALKGEISPISDLRASALYRREVAASVLAELLGRLTQNTEDRENG